MAQVVDRRSRAAAAAATTDTSGRTADARRGAGPVTHPSADGGRVDVPAEGSVEAPGDVRPDVSVPAPADAPADGPVAPRADVGAPADQASAGAADDGLVLTHDQVVSQSWRLVQNLVDALPDDVVRFVRRALADDDPGPALAALVFACVQLGTTLTTVEYAVLAECVVALGEDVTVLDHVSVGDVDRPVLFEFVAAPDALSDVAGPAGAAGAAGGATALPDASDGAADDVAAAAYEVDRAVVERMGGVEGVLGVWRAWRYPVTGAGWPRPTPVYLVEAEDEDAAAALRTSFYGAGDQDPRPGEPVLEVYVSGTELPPLHRALQFAGDLVVGPDEPVGFSFADVFDEEPDEAGRPQNITRISPDEAERLVTYLLSGTPMLVADTQGEDVLDPARGRVVPLHLRTDGEWIWSDATAYYVRDHLVAPPASFHEYLQSVPETAERVSDVALHHAVGWLQGS